MCVVYVKFSFYDSQTPVVTEREGVTMPWRLKIVLNLSSSEWEKRSVLIFLALSAD